MKLGTSFLATLPFLALQSDALPQKASKAPAFFLAGDSTTAVQSIGGGGALNPSRTLEKKRNH